MRRVSCSTMKAFEAQRKREIEAPTLNDGYEVVTLRSQFRQTQVPWSATGSPVHRVASSTPLNPYYVTRHGTMKRVAICFVI